MPIYTRKCKSCDEIWDLQCKIVEKDNDHECPYCGSIKGVWMLSAPAFSMRGDRFMTQKKDAGFKEVISKIAERNPGTKICEQT